MYIIISLWYNHKILIFNSVIRRRRNRPIQIITQYLNDHNIDYKSYTLPFSKAIILHVDNITLLNLKLYCPSKFIPSNFNKYV